MNRFKQILFCIGILVFLFYINHEKVILPQENRDMIETADTEESAVEVTSQEPAETFSSPIDFETLQAANSHVYAWMDIPGTTISYPILQHPTDDTFYLTHGLNGKKDAAGALFTERQYNKADFTDPVIIVYGHNMRGGEMFGRLQQSYSDAAYFSEHKKIVVYVPQRELHYEIFAAVPFENWHILYNYNFSNRRLFKMFFKELLSIRAIGANFEANANPEEAKQVLILSTCLKGNRNKRYLVCAKYVEQENGEENK